MDAALFYRQRSAPEMDDLIATFVENELGRFDWANNWAAYKVKYPNYLPRIRGFFHRLGEDIDPEEIAKYLDTMVVARPGPWR
jgi:hypothetical protein